MLPGYPDPRVILIMQAVRAARIKLAIISLPGLPVASVTISDDHTRFVMLNAVKHLVLALTRRDSERSEE